MALTPNYIGTAYTRLTYAPGETLTTITDAVESALDGTIQRMGWTSIYAVASRVNGSTAAALMFSAPLDDGTGTGTSRTDKKYMRLYFKGLATGYLRMACGTAASFGTATTVDSTTTLTHVGHTMLDGDRIIFHNLETVTGVTEGLEYFVVNSVAATSFEVAILRGGAGITLTNTDTVRYTALRNQNYDGDYTTNANNDTESQPYSDGGSGAINIYATKYWCAIYSTVAAATPRQGGKTTFFWNGVFEVKRENSEDILDNGMYPFGYISGKRAATGVSTHTLMFAKSYWGEVDLNGSRDTAIATTYGVHGVQTDATGIVLAQTTTAGLAPHGKKLLFDSSYSGWALDIRVWAHGPATTPIEAVCVGRIYGLKAFTGNQGGVGSISYVKIDTDYMYDPAGTAEPHQVLTAFSAANCAKFLIPQDA